MALDRRPDRRGGGSAVVIGAGINGLVAAAALARRGVAVTVVERASRPGGMAAGAGGTAELAQYVRGPHPAALTELGLSPDDLSLGPALPTVALSPAGRHVVIDRHGLHYGDGAPHPDAAAFAALTARLGRFARVLAPLLVTAPPRLGGWRSRGGVVQLSRLARLGLDLRRLGRPDMREFLRVALSNAHDVLLDALPDGPAAGALALDAVLGCRMGPRSPGTVVTLLYRLMQGALHRPEGGMAGLAGRLAAAAEARGAELRCGAGGHRHRGRGRPAAGVRLQDGAERAGRDGALQPRRPADAAPRRGGAFRRRDLPARSRHQGRGRDGPCRVRPARDCRRLPASTRRCWAPGWCSRPRSARSSAPSTR